MALLSLSYRLSPVLTGLALSAIFLIFHAVTLADLLLSSAGSPKLFWRLNYI
jgi:hypothetical protein